MEEHSEIWSKLIRRKKPTLPENFFKSFPADLSAQLKDAGESVGADFEKTKKPAVPADFFQHFHANLQAEIEAENAFSELKLVKRKRPTVPSTFKDDFNAKLMAQIRPESSTSGGRILKITFWSTAAAAAASLLLLITFNTTNTVSENPVAETPVAAPDDEALEPYVAYLDEESVIDYIIENDIQVGESETSDEVYDYVDSEIEEAYLDL